jgi:high-affinity Fe2+/Pb2+ permease
MKRIIGALAATFVIMGTPILACLSFVLEWQRIFRVMYSALFVLVAMVVACVAWERSEDVGKSDTDSNR